jgi:hypothetical protein
MFAFSVLTRTDGWEALLLFSKDRECFSYVVFGYWILIGMGWVDGWKGIEGEEG